MAQNRMAPEGILALVLVLPSSFGLGVEHALSQCGFRVSVATTEAEVLSRLESSPVDVAFVLVDDAAFTGTVERALRASSDTPLIVLGPDRAELMQQALASGAADYLAWPTTPQLLEGAVMAATLRARAAPAVVSTPSVAGLLGSSPQLTAAREALARAARGNATVLLRGETGTGKDLAARAIHLQSPRHRGPFVKVHTPAVPDALLESELFGYERGAFTGAVARKLGRVELAQGGTLFLDEVGDVSPAIQAKLLRLLQDREYERLGGTRTLSADIRVVAATHRDLQHLVDSGRLREDLYYRLNVITVWLPPLRARREDIALIANHYLALFAKENQKRLTLDEAALLELQSARWPGNVRQLVNFIERLAVLSPEGTITREDVRRERDEHAFMTQAAPGELAVPSPAADAGPGLPSSPQPSQAGAEPGEGSGFTSAVRPLKEDLRRTERKAITKALRFAKGNRALAARLLGVSRRTLYTKLEEHGIDE